MKRTISTTACALVVLFAGATGCSVRSSRDAAANRPTSDAMLLAMKPAGTNAIIIHALGYGTGSITIGASAQNCVTYDWEDSQHYSQVCWAYLPATTASVTVATSPTNGSQFTGWVGSPCTGSADTTCTVPMDQDRFISVGFWPGGAAPPRTNYTLIVEVLGFEDGTIAASPDVGLACTRSERRGVVSTCSATVPNTVPPTVVTLAATQLPAGAPFSGWGGRCSGTGNCSVTLNRDVSVTAAFGGVSNSLSPVITLFQAAPATITAGESATLQWTTINADSLRIDPAPGTVSGSSATVSPQTSTTYTLTASNESGQATRTVTVLVQSKPTPPTIAGFTTSSSSIKAGELSTLTWQVQGASTVSLDQGIGTVSGTSLVVAPYATTTYTLTASNAGGSAVQSVTVAVVPGAPGIAYFLATPVSFGSGQSTTLSWAAPDATTLVIDNGIGVVTGISVTVTPSASTTYTLTATNSAGSTSAHVRIWIPPDASGRALATSATATSMFSTRSEFVDALLQNGTVLVAGGMRSDDGSWVTSAAELYDPTTGTWTQTGSMHHNRRLFAGVVLPSGRVLVAGGLNEYGVSGPTNPAAFQMTAEVYDPASQVWTETALMTAPRAGHTATLLSDGKVLLVGGLTATAAGGMTPLASAEVFDPATSTWSPVGSLSVPRFYHTASLLPSGEVIVAGGSGGNLYGAEIFNPVTKLWRLVSPMNDARSGHGAVLLPSGRVLVFGGWGIGAGASSVEEYDPSADAWTRLSPTLSAKTGYTAALLGDGRVAVIGGGGSDPLTGWYGIRTSIEVYDRVSDTWVSAGQLAYGRSWHTSTVLADGNILVTGGSNWSSGPLSSAELVQVK